MKKGEIFCENAREIEKVKSPDWFAAADILDLATRYNIEGVFVDKNKEHWMFMPQVENGIMTLYDPKNYYKKGTMIRDELPDKGHIFVVTEGIRTDLEAKGFDGLSMFGGGGDNNVPFLGEMLHRIEQTGYKQKIIDMGRIQTDGYNCGPLAVFAAAVANAHTPKYREKVNARKIADELKVNIR
jgi:hypothetical protein